MESTNIRDEETGEPLDWGDIFFNLHKHCNLSKWEIWEYTLPQIAELMKRINRYIQFEIETRMAPLGIFGGVGGEVSETGLDDSDYEEMTEEDFHLLSTVLSGA